MVSAIVFVRLFGWLQPMITIFSNKKIQIMPVSNKNGKKLHKSTPQRELVFTHAKSW